MSEVLPCLKVKDALKLKIVNKPSTPDPVYRTVRIGIKIVIIIHNRVKSFNTSERIAVGVKSSILTNSFKKINLPWISNSSYLT